LGVIATALSEADPENAATYAANAAAGRAEIDAATQAAQDTLEAHHTSPYVTFHDAYQYYERRFDLAAVGAIAIGDASAPGPARLAAIRELVQEAGASCVFAETQFPQRLVDTVLDGTGARLSVLDPLGTDLPLGQGFYPALITGLADQMAECL